MRVGVNLLWCRPGRVGGSEEYLVRQLLGLAVVAPDDLRPIARATGFAAAHPELDAHFELITAESLTRFRPARIAAEDVLVPRRLVGRRRRPPRRRDAARRVIAARRCSRSTTSSTCSYPQYFSRLRRTYLGRRVPLVGASRRRSSPCPATSSRPRWSTPSDAMLTISSSCRTASTRLPPRSLPDAGELRRRYRLGERRVLVYPAITHPHKGHRLLVELLAGPWADPDLVLVLLGGAGAAEPAVAAAIADHAPRPTGSFDPDGCRRRPRRADRRSPRRSCSRRSTRASAPRCSRRWRSARR